MPVYGRKSRPTKILNLSGPNLGTNHSALLLGKPLSVGACMLRALSVDSEKGVGNRDRRPQGPEEHFSLHYPLRGKLPRK